MSYTVDISYLLMFIWADMWQFVEYFIEKEFMEFIEFIKLMAFYVYFPPVNKFCNGYRFFFTGIL